MRSRGLFLVAAALQAFGCASGNGPYPDDSALNPASDTSPETHVLLPEATVPPDAYVPPDAPPPPDVLPPDAGPPDSGPLGDGASSCPDPYEPNESCAAAKSIGSAPEGNAWYSREATTYPAGEADWFIAIGEEQPHTCMPFASQTYYFKVKLTVPAGRQLRVCLYQDSCSGSGNCADNASATGPTELVVQYEVDGICTLNDDTVAKIMVDTLDGAESCTPYTIAYNYDE